MSYYMKSFATPLVVGSGIVAMFAGGPWMWVGFFIVNFLGVFADQLLGDDTSEPEVRHPWLLNAVLYSTLPLLWLASVAYAWQLSPNDFLGLGAWIQSITGYDVLAAKAQNTWFDYLGGGLSLGLTWAAVGTVIAHELTHRTWSLRDMVIGRLMLALTADASFAIEHVYGHHRNVGTRKDPATARRGENAWRFLVRSTVMSYLSAWRIEPERLRKRGHGVWTWRNRMLRGNLMTLGYAAFFGWAAGWVGVLAYIAIALYGKAYLEFVNYLEHYGIVRVPGQPVEPRHSWNSNRLVSSTFLYNLTRHSHHHAEDEKPFWKLRPYHDAPMLPFGYLPMIYIAAIPPLWNRIMIPKVLEWDRRYATEAERPYIEEANRLSGRREFLEALKSSAGTAQAA